MAAGHLDEVSLRLALEVAVHVGLILLILLDAHKLFEHAELEG